MKVENRWNKIRNLLRERGYISIQDLSTSLSVSEATIRRDLVKMEENDMLERLWGGARLKGNEITNENANFDDTYILKFSLNLDRKTAIAKAAAALINDGDCVFIDAGSTTSMVVEHITANDILVVTNSIACIQTLAKKNIRTYMLNGYLNAGASAVLSEDTAQKISTINFNKVFLGANALDKEAGYTSRNSYDSEIKAAAIGQGEQNYVLADSSKFNVKRAFSFAGINDVKLISDQVPDFMDAGQVILGEV